MALQSPIPLPLLLGPLQCLRQSIYTRAAACLLIRSSTKGLKVSSAHKSSPGDSARGGGTGLGHYSEQPQWEGGELLVVPGGQGPQAAHSILCLLHRGFYPRDAEPHRATRECSLYFGDLRLSSAADGACGSPALLKCSRELQALGRH